MFTKRFTLFRLFGFEVKLDLTWLLLAFLVTWSLALGLFPQVAPGLSTAAYWWMGVAGAIGLLFSIVFHEFSHSLVARRYGLPISGITLFIFGGVAEMEEEPRSARVEFLMAIAGPISSLVLAFVFYLIYQEMPLDQPTPVGGVVYYLGMINLVLALFNLVPGFPLDGGRVMRAFWWWRTGSLDRATRVASDMGKGFALALIFLGAYVVFQGALVGGIWLIFIGMFLRGSAEQGYQQMVLMRSLENVTVGDVMVDRPVTVPPDLSLKRLVDDYFLRYGYRGFPVVEDGRAVGVVSVSRLQAVPEGERAGKTVAEVMDRLDGSRTVEKEAPLLEALEKMGAPGVGRLLVVRDDGRLEGLVTKTGVVRLLEVSKVLGTRIDVSESLPQGSGVSREGDEGPV